MIRETEEEEDKENFPTSYDFIGLWMSWGLKRRTVMEKTKESPF